jgi:F-type H+-transporting ATPase subunit gamma
LKDLRNRIASVKATQKITKAMQMVAAAKLRRAQMAAEAARPFAERMESVLANLAGGMGEGAGAPALLAGNGKDQVHLLVVCTAERGLCGAFNSSIVRLARERANTLMAQGKTVKILCVGKKGWDQLRRQFERQIIDLVDLRSLKQIGFENANEIAMRIIAMFERGEFDVCTIFFSRFRSVIAQFPTAQRLIPAEIPASKDASGPAASYEYEPGARMSAMDNATRNAGDMIKKQTQLYNRSRQAMITKELIEIISGAEAL